MIAIRMTYSPVSNVAHYAMLLVDKIDLSFLAKGFLLFISFHFMHYFEINLSTNIIFIFLNIFKWYLLCYKLLVYVNMYFSIYLHKFYQSILLEKLVLRALFFFAGLPSLKTNGRFTWVLLACVNIFLQRGHLLNPT